MSVCETTEEGLKEQLAVAVGNWVNIQDGAAQLSAIFSGGFAIFSHLHLLNTRYVRRFLPSQHQAAAA